MTPPALPRGFISSHPHSPRIKPRFHFRIPWGSLMFRHFGLAAAALLSLAGSGGALAADLAVKAPAASLASTCEWCGFYVGGNAGYAWGRNNESSVFSTPAPFLDVDAAAV